MSAEERFELRGADGERYRVDFRADEDGRYAVRRGDVTISTFSDRKRAEAFVRALVADAAAKAGETKRRRTV